MQIEVQMFQLYRDGLEDLLKDTEYEDPASAAPLEIVLAESSATGLVHVEGSNVCGATTPMEVMQIFAKGAQSSMFVNVIYFLLILACVYTRCCKKNNSFHSIEC